MSIIKSRRPQLVLTAAVCGVLLAPPAHAQQRMVVMEQDGGSGPQIAHFSLPDMTALRRPDYVRDDLPTFDRKLGLAEPQSTTVRERLEKYLDAFNALQLEILPPASSQGIQMFGGSGEGVFGFVADGNAIADPENLPEGGTVSIGIRVGGDGGVVGEDVDVTAGSGAGGDGAPGVFVTMDAADGEIPDEVREQLQKQAEEMAARIQEQMENGESSFEVADPAEVERSLAEHQAHMEELAEAARKFEIQKEALRKAFEADVQTELTPEQLERWPALERTLVRRKTLPQGQLTGESADLIAVLEGLGIDLDATTPIAEQALAYELALHDALVRRNAFVDEANEKVDEAMSNGDGQTALELVERGADYRMAVRDLNQRYAQTMEAVIGDERAADFADAARKALWSRVYRPTRAERAYEQARQLDDISEAKILQILELEQAFRAELDRVNAELVRTIDREEPLERVRSMERVADMMSGATPPGNMELPKDPVREAFRERRRFERRHMKNLYDMLTPEQVAVLPKMPSENDQPFVFSFGPGGQND